MMVEADLAGKVLLNCQPSKPINFTMWQIMKNVIEAHKKTDKRKNRRGRDSFCSFSRKTFETRLRLGPSTSPSPSLTCWPVWLWKLWAWVANSIPNCSIRRHNKQAEPLIEGHTQLRINRTKKLKERERERGCSINRE